MPNLRPEIYYVTDNTTFKLCWRGRNVEALCRFVNTYLSEELKGYNIRRAFLKNQVDHYNFGGVIKKNKFFWKYTITITRPKLTN